MRSLQTWKVDILARLSHPAGEPLPLCSLECVTSCKLAYTAPPHLCDQWQEELENINLNYA
jgi:hypothetical protein